MNIVQAVAALIQEDPNSILADQSSMTIDQNKASRDTSLVNQIIAKNQKKSEDQAKEIEKKAGDKAKKLQSQFGNLRKVAGEVNRSSADATKHQKQFNDVIQQIAGSMSDLEV